VFHVAQDLVGIKARIWDFYISSEDKNATYPLEGETDHPTTSDTGPGQHSIEEEQCNKGSHVQIPADLVKLGKFTFVVRTSNNCKKCGQKSNELK
jgi:hypothetical protein